MDKWAISLGVIVAILVGVVLYQRYEIKALKPAVPSETGPFGKLAKLLFLNLPNTLLLFGPIADLFNQEWHYITATFTALIGLVMNFYLGKVEFSKLATMFKSKKYTTPYTSQSVAPAGGPLVEEPPRDNPFSGGQRGGGPEYCTIPGFEVWESTFAPQNIIVTVTILGYLLIELWSTNSEQSIGLSVLTGVVVVLQSVFLINNGCLIGYKGGSFSIATGIVFGIILAVCGYYLGNMVNDKIGELIAKRSSSGGPVFPINPTPVTPVFPDKPTPLGPGGTKGRPVGPGGTQRQCPSGYDVVGNACIPSKKVSVGEPGEQVSADLDSGDYDELVGELFKDGQPISTVIGGVFDSSS